MARKKKVSEKLAKLISEIDTATGMLIVTAMHGNAEVKSAMEKLTDVSVELGDIACDLECDGNQPMLNACPEDYQLTHILRAGEPLEVKYPSEVEEEIEYIKDEMRFERQREERKGTYE